MNAPESIFTAQLGEAEVRVPREAAVTAYLEQEINRLRRANPTLQPAGEIRRALDVPAIGAEWEGGVYAGVTVYKNAPHHLLLLPGEAEAVDWDTAMKWARDRGGSALPTRIDQLVLFQNLKSEFKDTWYWSCEQYASDAEYAWLQHFYRGSQNYWPKSSKYRARAVRRIPI